MKLILIQKCPNFCQFLAFLMTFVKKQPAFEIASCAISAKLRRKDAAVEIVPPAKAESHDRKKL
jgi:hypothetical protein